MSASGSILAARKLAPPGDLEIGAAINYDGVSHHALGGPSHVFKERYTEYLAKIMSVQSRNVDLHIVIQPNSSPHIGTMCSLALMFAIGEEFRSQNISPNIIVDIWDNANAEMFDYGGVVYQKGLRTLERTAAPVHDLTELLESLKKISGIDYQIRSEEEFLRLDGLVEVVTRVIREREVLAVTMAPHSEGLAIRSPCPHVDCGLVDKKGVHNVFDDEKKSIQFQCPLHGTFSVFYEQEPWRLQFNCQLFGLVIARFYENYDRGYIQVCGSDYAGFWMEQLLWRHISNPLIILYTPLITDWSGSKISKSLYLCGGAYDYLIAAGLEYLLSWDVFKREETRLDALWAEIQRWVREPYRLFRCYSLHYMHMVIDSGKDTKQGLIHIKDRVRKVL